MSRYFAMIHSAFLTFASPPVNGIAVALAAMRSPMYAGWRQQRQSRRSKKHAPIHNLRLPRKTQTTQ